MNKERIALCFYGQPRKLEEGIKHTLDFINEKCKYFEVDIFIHIWWHPSVIGQKFSCATWSSTTKENERFFKEDTIALLTNTLNPVKIIYEKPKMFEDETELVKTLDLYKNISEHSKKLNLTNSISNIYSKFKVGELFEKYAKENNYVYKVIISARFDVNIALNLFDPSTCIPNKIYQFYRNEKIIPPLRTYIYDPLLAFTNTEYFTNYSKSFLNIKNINDSKICREAAEKFNLNFEFNAEEIVTFNLCLYYSQEEIINSFIYVLS